MSAAAVRSSRPSENLVHQPGNRARGLRFPQSGADIEADRRRLRVWITSGIQRSSAFGDLLSDCHRAGALAKIFTGYVPARQSMMEAGRD